MHLERKLRATLLKEYQITHTRKWVNILSVTALDVDTRATLLYKFDDLVEIRQWQIMVL